LGGKAEIAFQLANRPVLSTPSGQALAKGGLDGAPDDYLVHGFEGARLQAFRLEMLLIPALAAEGSPPQGLKANPLGFLSARLKAVPLQRQIQLYIGTDHIAAL
jgi:hypothetical protein